MRYWLGLLLAFVLLFGFALPAFALDPPDSESIDEVYAYRNLIETGDVLIIFQYDIEYATTPNETIKQGYIFRLIDVDGTTEIAQVLGYPYNDHGFGFGISGFYFSAADNLTWDEAYFIRISGNPVYLPALADVSFAIPASAWYSSSDGPTNQTALAARVVDMVGNLEAPWGVTLIDTNSAGQVVLNTTGENYILAAIPGLGSMAPAAFQVQLFDMDYTAETWADTQADAYRDRFVGTWVDDAQTALAGITTMNFQLTLSIVFIVAAVLLMAAYRMKFNESTPAILDVLALRYLWVLLGWISLGISAVITLLLAAMLGYILLFDRS